MKNIERYSNTKGALEAYELRDKAMSHTFHEWCYLECNEPRPLTLLDALRTARAILTPISLTAFQPAGYKKIVQAIEAEETRPKTNYERFGTAGEATQYFRMECRMYGDCNYCPMKDIYMNPCNFGRMSCFAKWLYSTEDVLKK